VGPFLKSSHNYTQNIGHTHWKLPLDNNKRKQVAGTYRKSSKLREGEILVSLTGLLIIIHESRSVSRRVIIIDANYVVCDV